MKEKIQSIKERLEEFREQYAPGDLSYDRYVIRIGDIVAEYVEEVMELTNKRI